MHQQSRVNRCGPDLNTLTSRTREKEKRSVSLTSKEDGVLRKERKMQERENKKGTLVSPTLEDAQFSRPSSLSADLCGMPIISGMPPGGYD